MNGQFVISRGLRDLFLTEEKLHAYAQAGLLSPSDRVYHPQLGKWLYARDVAEVEADLMQSQVLGQRPLPDSVLLVPVNTNAVTGFILATLGYLPFLGLVFSGLGLYFSGQGMLRAQGLHGSGHRLALAGLVLSLLLFMPQLCIAVLLLGT